jgi:hypothetical protein
MTDYIQYVYHFHYPMNSVDVRTITSEELEYLTILFDNPDPETEHFQETFNTILKMFKDHFPEYAL